jgi:hypothetical protein
MLSGSQRDAGFCVPDAQTRASFSSLEAIVEQLFLVPPRALGAVDVVVTSIVLRIGTHFNFPDPALDVPIVDPSAGPEAT